MKDFKLVEKTQDLEDAKAEYGAAMGLAFQLLPQMTKAGIIRVFRAIVLAPVVAPDLSKMQAAELELFKRVIVQLDRKQALMDAMIRDMEADEKDADAGLGETGPGGDVA